MTFSMPNGTVENLELFTFKKGSVLEFDWWGNTVCFELANEQGGSRIIFVQKLAELTGQTAVWHKP